MIEVKEMVKRYLMQNGFDGLYWDNGEDEKCGCGVKDLFPCGEIYKDCIAAKKKDDKYYPAAKEEHDKTTKRKT